MRPWRPARPSASSRLTRSTTLKKRPRAPSRMQARAMAMARWVLPVPVPPTRTTLRWWARKSPPARSRTRVSLIGVPSKAKSSMSLASGSLAMVIWYLIERACFSAISAVQQVADDALRLVLALDRRGDDLVVGGLHAVELQLAHGGRGSRNAPSHGSPQAVVAGAVGDRLVPQPQRLRGDDR